MIGLAIQSMNLLSTALLDVWIRWVMDQWVSESKMAGMMDELNPSLWRLRKRGRKTRRSSSSHRRTRSVVYYYQSTEQRQVGVSSKICNMVSTLYSLSMDVHYTTCSLQLVCAMVSSRSWIAKHKEFHAETVILWFLVLHVRLSAGSCGDQQIWIGWCSFEIEGAKEGRLKIVSKAINITENK